MIARLAHAAAALESLSLTDACIGWEETEDLIRHFAGTISL